MQPGIGSQGAHFSKSAEREKEPVLNQPSVVPIEAIIRLRPRQITQVVVIPHCIAPGGSVKRDDPSASQGSLRFGAPVSLFCGSRIRRLTIRNSEFRSFSIISPLGLNNLGEVVLIQGRTITLPRGSIHMAHLNDDTALVLMCSRPPQCLSHRFCVEWHYGINWG